MLLMAGLLVQCHGYGERVRWPQDLAIESSRTCVVRDQPDAPVGLGDKEPCTVGWQGVVGI
jgi:hypothetical protein